MGRPSALPGAEPSRSAGRRVARGGRASWSASRKRPVMDRDRTDLHDRRDDPAAALHVRLSRPDHGPRARSRNRAVRPGGEPRVGAGRLLPRHRRNETGPVHGEGGALPGAGRQADPARRRRVPRRARRRRGPGRRRGGGPARTWRVVGLFPEGTSLPDQKRGYKRGAARLALASGAPLIPVALIGTELTLEPRTHRIPLPRVRIVIGEAIRVERQEPTERPRRSSRHGFRRRSRLSGTTPLSVLSAAPAILSACPHACSWWTTTAPCASRCAARSRSRATRSSSPRTALTGSRASPEPPRRDRARRRHARPSTASRCAAACGTTARRCPSSCSPRASR